MALLYSVGRLVNRRACESGRINVNVEFDKDDVVETSVREGESNVAGRLYTMSPVKPLPAGEYAVVFDNMFYDFGVDEPGK